MILENFMVKHPVALRPEDSLYHAAQVMAWTDSHHLPVTLEDDRLVGILTDRDILAYRAAEPEIDLRSTPISHAMHTSPQTAGPDSSLSEAAARLSQHDIGCLPVTKHGKLIGLVTRRDVLAAEVHLAMSVSAPTRTVADVMTANPVTVMPKDYVFEAAKKMSDAGVRHLPVVDEEGKAVGILSDRDIQAAVLDPEDYIRSTVPGEHRLVVQEVMSRPPMRVWAQESCGSVASLFILFRASAAVVTDSSDKLLGIVSYIDLLRSIAPETASYSQQST